jgi:hypothetical protein
VAGDRAGRGGGRPNGGWQRGRDGGAALEVADGDEDANRMKTMKGAAPRQR